MMTMITVMHSDDNFKPDDEYKEEFQKELRVQQQIITSSKVQDDHFQNTLEQHIDKLYYADDDMDFDHEDVSISQT